ncbi:hypothetical protein BGZ67_009306 [Mortierella alpina]|nr:hypothetical protein BGZ67_009306 [Mortierella alpina]
MPRDSAREPLLGHQNGSNQGNAASGGFGFTVDDLAPLTDPTNPTLPRQMGGSAKICEGLRVDPKVGLHSDEAGPQSTGHSDEPKFAARSKAFGRNILPAVQSASFFSLVKKAYNDRTLSRWQAATMVMQLLSFV